MTIGGVIAALFASLYPTLLVSTTDPAYTLTVANSSSSPYSLQVMTIAAAVLVPLVLAVPGLDLLRLPPPGHRPPRTFGRQVDHTGRPGPEPDPMTHFSASADR